LLTKAARWDAAAKHARVAADQALERGAYRRAGQLLARLSDVEQWRGNWSAARLAAEDALLLVDEDDPQAARAARYAVAVCSVLDHSWADAERLIAAETTEAPQSFFPQGPFLALRMRAQMAAKDLPAALQTGERLHELWVRSSDAFYGIGFSETFVDLLCRAGRFSKAEEILALCQQRLRWLPPELRPLPTAAIMMQKAHLAARVKGSSAAVSGFLEAEESYRQLAAPYQGAHAAAAAARCALEASGKAERQTARSALTRAHESLVALGSPEAEETGSLLRRMHWGKALSGTAMLFSRRETEVGTLVAEGLTNNQIAERLVVSPRTVDNHLARMFEKVGVHSRMALARELNARLLLSGKQD